VKVEVYLDGRYLGQSVGVALHEAVGKFLERIAEPKTGRDVLVRMVAGDVRSEFIKRGMLFTGELVGNVLVSGGQIVFNAPHAGKWAEGHQGVAVKGAGGLFYERSSDPVVLTNWVNAKAPQIRSKRSFRVNIPQRRGFARDAYKETIDRDIDALLNAWVDALAKNM